MKWKQGIYKLA